jgi:hypothetical protein
MINLTGLFASSSNSLWIVSVPDHIQDGIADQWIEVQKGLPQPASDAQVWTALNTLAAAKTFTVKYGGATYANSYFQAFDAGFGSIGVTITITGLVAPANGLMASISIMDVDTELALINKITGKNYSSLRAIPEPGGFSERTIILIAVVVVAYLIYSKHL